MKIIGLTGGIGSGKSTVAQVFEVLGAKLFIADTEANIITATHPVAIQRISDVFGAEIYQNGILNRKALASIVFEDPKKLQTLNSIVHPLVKEAFDNYTYDIYFLSNTILSRILSFLINVIILSSKNIIFNLSNFYIYFF